MKLKVPQGSFSAYLFDCDGTIADSMPLHYIAWKKALGEWNCEFDEALFYAWGGMPIAEIISTLNQRHGLRMSVETVSRRRKASISSRFRSSRQFLKFLSILRPSTAGFHLLLFRVAHGNR